MTTWLCFMVWMFAVSSDRNRSTTVSVLAFLALLSSCAGH